MSENTPALGKESRYQARHTGQIVISPEDSGAVMVYIPYALVNAGFNYSGIYAACIMLKDGTPSKNTIENLAKVFRLKSVDDFIDIQDIEPNADGTPEFELADWFEETYKDRVTIKPRWINTLGGGFRKEPLDAAGKKKLMTRLGGKLKAILAGVDHSAAAAEAETETETEAETETAVEEKPATRKPGPPPPPSRKPAARTSNQEEVWDKYYELNPNPNPKKTKENDYIKQLGEKFWGDEVVGSIVPNHNGELTDVQWGEVLTFLEQ